MAKSIVEHLNCGGQCLHPVQFGFRCHHSTETAFCVFIERLNHTWIEIHVLLLITQLNGSNHIYQAEGDVHRYMTVTLPLFYSRCLPRVDSGAVIVFTLCQ